MGALPPIRSEYGIDKLLVKLILTGLLFPQELHEVPYDIPRADTSAGSVSTTRLSF